MARIDARRPFKDRHGYVATKRSSTIRREGRLLLSQLPHLLFAACSSCCGVKRAYDRRCRLRRASGEALGGRGFSGMALFRLIDSNTEGDIWIGYVPGILSNVFFCFLSIGNEWISGKKSIRPFAVLEAGRSLVAEKERAVFRAYPAMARNDATACFTEKLQEAVEVLGPSFRRW